MTNILITGTNGFVGHNLYTLLEGIPSVNFIKGTRADLNLLNVNSVKEYLDKNNIEGIIHCAIEGGHRLKTYTPEITYNNILMFENLIKFNSLFKFFINIGTGAEFDLSKNIENVHETELMKSVPIDYYGLSKNIIAKRLIHYPNAINLRIFNCFYHNELSTRFISSCLTSYKNKAPIKIFMDKYMDFFYMKDLAEFIYTIIKNLQLIYYNDINMSYVNKYKLSEIANIVNGFDKHKVDIIIDTIGNYCNYTGASHRYFETVDKLNISQTGLINGMLETYHKLCT